MRLTFGSMVHFDNVYSLCCELGHVFLKFVIKDRIQLVRTYDQD